MNFSFISEWFYSFLFYAEMHGLAAVLAFICLLQYALNLYKHQRSSNRELSYLSDVKTLEGEVSDLKHKRYLARMESSALRDIFSNIEEGKTAELLLKIFIPHTSQGFALFYSDENSKLNVHAARGLSPKTIANLELDATWQKNLTGSGIMHISGKELFDSHFTRHLDRKALKKISELFLIPVLDNKSRIGVIASTHLFPQGIDEEFQKPLISRILSSVAGALNQSMTLINQDQKLKFSQEKLAMRSIADRNHETPSQLIDEYLLRMTSLLEANRSVLMLVTPDPCNPLKVICRQGSPLQAGTESKWQEHEYRLAQTALDADLLTCLDTHDLEELGVDTLIGSALTIPLYQHDKLIGILCITRKDQEVFTTMQIKLTRWSTDFLAETLLRVLGRAETERNANLDGLTELANRRMFDIKIEEELTRAKELITTCSLCMLDLDHFKEINDCYGHQAGDEVLKQFANILRAETTKVRATDSPLIARYGGEEMVIILPGIGRDGAVRIAESIRLATNKLVVLHNQHRIQFSVSTGVASFPTHANTAKDLIEAADQALYQAKAQGRNCVRLFTGNFSPNPPASIESPTQTYMPQ